MNQLVPATTMASAPIAAFGDWAAYRILELSTAQIRP